jgi:16S rRNA (adenine(1408)-N(1))-methyltransferase
METIRGRTSLSLDLNTVKDQLKNYDRTVLDLGTGDGRYVYELANHHPDWFVVGVDACRENLRDRSRAKLPNMLFIIAPAQELPCEFEGLFWQVTINFPWGSLLDGLLACDPGLMRGLASISRLGAQIEIHLNSGALKEAGTSLEAGAAIIHENMEHHGWDLQHPHPMEQGALAKFPTTWARRLAHGRDPLAMNLSGRRA